MNNSAKLNTQNSKIKEPKGRQNAEINAEKNGVIRRLHRIKGQIEGVEIMVEEGKDCSLVIHQIMAARAALGSVAVKLLTDASCRASGKQEQAKLEQLINQLLKFQ